MGKEAEEKEKKLSLDFRKFFNKETPQQYGPLYEMKYILVINSYQ